MVGIKFLPGCKKIKTSEVVPQITYINRLYVWAFYRTDQLFDMDSEEGFKDNEQAQIKILSLLPKAAKEYAIPIGDLGYEVPTEDIYYEEEFTVVPTSQMEFIRLPSERAKAVSRPYQWIKIFSKREMQEIYRTHIFRGLYRSLITKGVGSPMALRAIVWPVHKKIGWTYEESIEHIGKCTIPSQFKRVITRLNNNELEINDKKRLKLECEKFNVPLLADTDSKPFLANMFARNGINLVFGQPGIGKSTLISLLLSETVKHRVDALVFSPAEERYQLESRVRFSVESMTNVSRALQLENFPADLEALEKRALEHVAQCVSDVNHALIVIDGIHHYLEQNLREPMEALRFLTLLKSIDATWVIVGHPWSADPIKYVDSTVVYTNVRTALHISQRGEGRVICDVRAPNSEPAYYEMGTVQHSVDYLIEYMVGDAPTTEEYIKVKPLANMLAAYGIKVYKNKQRLPRETRESLIKEIRDAFPEGKGG